MQRNGNSLAIVITLALLISLAWVAAGASFGMAPTVHSHAQVVPAIYDATARLSYSDAQGATPTATPSGEPEWSIMQYVVAANPSWICGPIGGTPGHRTLGCYTGAGHSGAGTVDNYGDPASASANWLQRRANAQATYPVFRDTSWNGYPGYHAEGPRPPYGFFTQEDYYWADVRVLGGTRVDDTHFYYAPDIATAIMNAAQALGYLPTPSPTPIVTPSVTPTITPTTSPIVSPTSSPSPTPIITPTPCAITFSDVPLPTPSTLTYAVLRAATSSQDMLTERSNLRTT